MTEEIRAIFAITMLTTASIFLCALFWWGYCSKKTSKHRMQLLDWIFCHKNYEELQEYFDMVSYDDHMRALIWFKDPFKLYDPDMFSTFHLIKHGTRTSVLTKEGNRYHNKEIICPYIPK